VQKARQRLGIYSRVRQHTGLKSIAHHYAPRSGAVFVSRTEGCERLKALYIPAQRIALGIEMRPT